MQAASYTLSTGTVCSTLQSPRWILRGRFAEQGKKWANGKKKGKKEGRESRGGNIPETNALARGFSIARYRCTQLK